MARLLGLLVCGSVAAAGSQHFDQANGAYTLRVDGEPFIIIGAQCDIWRSTRQDADTLAFLNAYSEMNATAVGLGIPWSYIEKTKDVYDMTFLDWFIAEARKRHLKIVAHLFSTNVCGKIGEVSPTGYYPQYAPDYILADPGTYQRMDLGKEGQYAWAGTPMCPNDPDTRAREAKYVARVAEHLRREDSAHTVVMVQINNEFYYQQWVTPPENPAKVRCHCADCEAIFDPAEAEEHFMYRSLAEYARDIAAAFREVYDIPLYVNSPWWPNWVAELFLETCPSIDLVGMDGVFTPNEPNQLSTVQLGRNIPFASECPTENAETQRNLGVLPFYVLLRRLGIGNLLWDAGASTMVENIDARRRYGAALYPIKHAMGPIAAARGTDRLIGWYAQVHRATSVPEVDVFGEKTGGTLPGEPAIDQLFLREGPTTRLVEGAGFTCRLAGLNVDVSASMAGVLIAVPDIGVVVATSGANLVIEGLGTLAVGETGRFEGNIWKSEGRLPIRQEEGRALMSIPGPNVVLLRLP